MYRLLFILSLVFSLCFLTTEKAHAQRYLPGQKGIQLTGGFVDGFSLDKASFGSIGLSSYTQNGNRWVFAAEYLQKNYGYKHRSIPVSQIAAEGGYYFKLLSDPSKTFFFSIGTSAITGYETINWGKQLLFDGASITSEDNFLYGGAVSFEIETFLTDRVVLLANVGERLLFGSEINKFHTQVGVGIKVIIN